MKTGHAGGSPGEAGSDRGPRAVPWGGLCPHSRPSGFCWDGERRHRERLGAGQGVKGVHPEGGGVVSGALEAQHSLFYSVFSGSGSKPRAERQDGARGEGGWRREKKSSQSC